jgi:hypothetical protein
VCRNMSNSLTRARTHPQGLSWLAHAWALALLYKGRCLTHVRRHAPDYPSHAARPPFLRETLVRTGTGGSTPISGGLGRLLIGGLLDRRGQLLPVRSPGQYHVAEIERVASAAASARRAHYR